MHANPNRTTRSETQPDWVCSPCGTKWGYAKTPFSHIGEIMSTYHEDNCGVCGERTSVTEARDYGYLVHGWQRKHAA
jgi:hypothetical protein